MRGNSTKSMQELMKEFSNQKNIKRPMQEAKIVNLWRPLMGELINKYTESVYVKNQTLFIKVSQAALKNELLYLQEQIIEKINNEIGEEAINKLVIL